DAGMARMQDPANTDPRMDPEINPMPFDGARLIFGGFSPVVGVEAPTTNKPGDFLWYELLTTDVEAAQAFYGQILPWTFADSGQADMDYRIASAPDVDQTVSDIQARGGAVQMPAMDIPMVGRMAMVADPQGAPLYVMKGSDPRKSLAFADDRPRVGHAAWNELHTADPAGAWAFYGETFGWVKDGEMDMGPLGQYQFIRHGGMIGAMMATTEGEPSGWSVYFRVADIDVARQAVEASGGQVVQGPDPIPGGEYSMNCIDPQGAAFGLVGVRKG
ncbi:MAG TPA: VOC family protein, partial [Phenylobacterium sp.]|nr:VOC family protein [Phenylobacterium sp.]